MSPEENLALFEAIKAQASTAAVPACDGMTEQFDRDVGRTLRMTFHAPTPSGAPHKIGFGIFYPAVEGAPPSYATGNLARSMIRTPASGGIVASAMVGNTADYAAIQEFGGETWPNRSAFLAWHNTQGWWRKRAVHIGEHSYLGRTVRFDIANGSLTRAAMEGWQAHMTLLA